MNNKSLIPSPEQLHGDPQLAVLAVLEAATDAAIPALAAVYPEVGNLDFTHHPCPEIDAAICVVELARALAITLRQYKRALRDANKREQDLIPF